MKTSSVVARWAAESGHGQFSHFSNAAIVSVNRTTYNLKAGLVLRRAALLMRFAGWDWPCPQARYTNRSAGYFRFRHTSLRTTGLSNSRWRRQELIKNRIKAEYTSMYFDILQGERLTFMIGKLIVIIALHSFSCRVVLLRLETKITTIQIWVYVWEIVETCRHSQLGTTKNKLSWTETC